ncbi:hypothetical protein HMPREF9966_0183 [Streptococcus anginosus SK52 = DSM 20563]|nr:hypothetical protein HMPREF9966_0183 [Streptococcus anginosus SK52 = DSM 20563]BBD41807.1 hypothetical protein SA27298_0331 [Streptococcus anginosus]
MFIQFESKDKIYYFCFFMYFAAYFNHIMQQITSILNK